MSQIAQGAEARILLNDNIIVKERIKKNYRIPELDNKIRKKNTRFEHRLLKKAENVVNVPQLIKSCDKSMIIKMEYIDGKKLRDMIDNISQENRKELFKKIGKDIAKLHNNDIIHGDLTTSNFIIKDNKIYFIDFGLGFVSDKIEDKAVDIHLLKQALKSKHHMHFEELFNHLIESYKSEINNPDNFEKRFEKVESRGRYKKNSSSRQSSC